MKKINSFLVFIFLMSTLFSAVFVNGYSPSDSLKNTGFESNLNYWVGEKILIVEDSQWLPSHTGGKSLMILHHASGDGKPYIYQEVNYQGDKVTEIGGYFRNTGTESARVRIYLNYVSGSFQVITRWVPNDSNWHKVTIYKYQLSFQSSTYTLARLVFSFQNYGGGELFVDDTFIGYDGGSTGGGWV